MNKYFGAIANKSVMLSVDMTSFIDIELRAILRRNKEFSDLTRCIGISGTYSLLCSKDVLLDVYNNSSSVVFKSGMLNLYNKLSSLDSSDNTVYTELCITHNGVRVLYGESEQLSLPLIVFSPLLDFIVDTVLGSVVHLHSCIAI